MLNKIVCIVGPTGVGKTDLAFKTAWIFDGELVSADSVQVYKGLDIISGKDIPKDSEFTSLPELAKNGHNTGFYSHNNIPIFLLDLVEPTSSFTASQFCELAENTIDYIFYKIKVPIVVGGTGLYIKLLTEGLDTLREPDLELRKKLEGLSLEELQECLKQLDKEKFSSMNNSDVNNKRRLIRTIEIVSFQLPTTNYKLPTKYESLTIGLMCDKEVLKQRINLRVEDRLKHGGLAEVETLFTNYENLSRQVKDANGYRQLFMFLNNEISFDEAIYRWKIAEYRHAKNQMTWFRKYGNVKWFDIKKKGFSTKINKTVETFLKS